MATLPLPAPHPSLTGAAQAVILGGAVAIAVSVAIAPGWGGFLALGWLAAVALMRRWPGAGLAALLSAVPLEQRIAVPVVAGEPSLPEYLAWALAAAWLIDLARRRRLVVDAVGVLHALVVVALVASWGAGGARLASWWEEVLHWTLPLAVYLVCRSLPLPAAARWWAFGGLAAGVLVSSAMSWWQLATGAGPESYTVGGMVRVFGAYTHPNTLSGFLAMALPPLTVAAIAARSRRLSMLAGAAAAAGAVTLVLTQSRGGWLALAAAMAILLLASPRAVQRMAVAGGASLALLAVATGSMSAIPGTDRLATIAAPTEPVQVTPATWGQLERQAHWGAAWSMLEADPLFGVGAGEYNDSYRDHTPEWRFRVGRGNAHNAYLHLGAQAGVPGLVAYTGWVVAMAVMLAHRALSGHGAARWLAVGALGTVAALAVDGMFEYFDMTGLLVLVAVTVGLALGTDRPGPRRLPEAGGDR